MGVNLRSAYSSTYQVVVVLFLSFFFTAKSVPESVPVWGRVFRFLYPSFPGILKLHDQRTASSGYFKHVKQQPPLVLVKALVGF
jgi:hypothetical protein